MPVWQQQIKEYLSFSKSERHGIIVLVIVLSVLILSNFLLPIIQWNKPVDFSNFEDQIRHFENRQQAVKDSLSLRQTTGSSEKSKLVSKIKPFEFDPNGLPAELWKKLGLDDWQIKVIKNFESKGGSFKQKSDLAKIYSISEEEYLILEPYIVIKNSPFERTNHGNYKNNEKRNEINDSILTLPLSSEEVLIVELNTADTLDLQQLRGIGSFISFRIVKYRNLLGGFYSAEQLLEVYGMDSAKYFGLVNNVTVDASQIKKININKATIKEMTKHPYIEFYLAKSIIEHRAKIGEYTDIEQIKQAKLIYEELYKKISPYLTIK